MKTRILVEIDHTDPEWPEFVRSVRSLVDSFMYRPGVTTVAVSRLPDMTAPRPATGLFITSKNKDAK